MIVNDSQGPWSSAICPNISSAQRVKKPVRAAKKWSVLITLSREFLTYSLTTLYNQNKLSVSISLQRSVKSSKRSTLYKFWQESTNLICSSNSLQKDIKRSYTIETVADSNFVVAKRMTLQNLTSFLYETNLYFEIISFKIENQKRKIENYHLKTS